MDNVQSNQNSFKKNEKEKHNIPIDWGEIFIGILQTFALCLVLLYVGSAFCILISHLHTELMSFNRYVGQSYSRNNNYCNINGK